MTADFNGRRVLLHFPSGTYLALDRTAASIVDLLNEDPDPTRVAEVLVQNFGISFDRALNDVTTVISTVSDLSVEREGRGHLPTVGGARAVAGSCWRMPWHFKVLTVRVVGVVLIVEVGLKLLSLTKLARLMRVPIATDISSASVAGPEDLSALADREREAYWAVEWVLDRWFYDGTCLRRALAFGWFVRRFNPVLRLGMIEDGESTAHAWIELEGVAYNALRVTGSFVSGAIQSGLSGANSSALQPL